MDKNIINKILDLNTSFYSNVEESFHTSRQYPWKGWGKAFEIITNQLGDKKELSVLDLGCGNGRFCRFLSENIKNFPIDYLGVDNNKFLLKKAYEEGFLVKTSNPRFNLSFQNLDIIKNLESIEDSFDLIVAFGITHHIPGKEFRKSWFEKLSKLAKKEGLVVFTIWNYAKDDRSKKLLKKINAIPKKDLEKGDYFLGWDETENIYRYFHDYSKEEVKEIEDVFNNKGFELLKKFKSDGKEDRLNTYFVFKKTL